RAAATAVKCWFAKHLRRGHILPGGRRSGRMPGSPGSACPALDGIPWPKLEILVESGPASSSNWTHPSREPAASGGPGFDEEVGPFARALPPPPLPDQGLTLSVPPDINLLRDSVRLP